MRKLGLLLSPASLPAVAALAALMVLLVAAGTPASAAAQLQPPVLLVSAGQSPDAVMVRVLLRRVNIEPELLPTATAANVKDQKTLIVVIGASSKGLGAAGINLNQEQERLVKLLAAAKAKGIKIVAMHLGGSARRGGSSDKLIEMVLPQADVVVVVTDGNKDGYFTKNKPKAATLYSVDRIADVSKPLEELFGK